MQRHLDAGHERLPLVVQILFCHGRATPWPYTLNWLELFNEPEVARQLYNGSFPLVDVGALDDDDIMKHKRMAMLELLLKHSHIRDLMAVIEPLVCLLEEGYTTQARLTALMHWMLHTANTVEPVAFVKELAHRTPQHREEFMTIAQALEQGRLEAMQDVARSLLKMEMSWRRLPKLPVCLNRRCGRFASKDCRPRPGSASIRRYCRFTIGKSRW